MKLNSNYKKLNKMFKMNKNKKKNYTKVNI